VNELQSSIKALFASAAAGNKAVQSSAPAATSTSAAPKDNPFSYAMPDYEIVKQMYARASNDPNIHLQDYLPGGNQYSNINAKSRSETLRLSRLADALNNMYYRTPRSTGNYSRVYGGGISGESTDQGQLYQMPVTTEEMREMSRQGQYESAVRGAEIARQQGAMDLALEYEKLRQQAAFQRTQYAFENELTKYQIPVRQAQTISSLVMGNWPLAQLYAAVFAGTSAPTPQQVLFYKEQADIADNGKKAGLSNAEISGQMAAAALRLGAAGLSEQLNIAPELASQVIESIKSGIQGVTK